MQRQSHAKIKGLYHPHRKSGKPQDRDYDEGREAGEKISIQAYNKKYLHSFDKQSSAYIEGYRKGFFSANKASLEDKIEFKAGRNAGLKAGRLSSTETPDLCKANKSIYYIEGYKQGFARSIANYSKAEREYNRGFHSGSIQANIHSVCRKTFHSESDDYIKGYTDAFKLKHSCNIDFNHEQQTQIPPSAEPVQLIQEQMPSFHSLLMDLDTHTACPDETATTNSDEQEKITRILSNIEKTSQALHATFTFFSAVTNIATAPPSEQNETQPLPHSALNIKM